ncbi:MAG: TIGR04283 family arsenosugar biosynthesis glycosyltransferase, partial [Planctomycetaceae bacterium]|nr:TIGR04283 family arsenosugar biosynthesis glycosyltransferase [Planctomycetaceae bacterium]
PTLNESSQIAACIQSCRDADCHEVIVVDAGINDDTISLAGQADKVITSDRGRSRQQNVGASVATGDVLLFLHADCRLPATAVADICEALSRSPQIIAGCFQQRIDNDNWKYRITEWGDLWRVRLLGWMYGDQGIFVRRDVFERVGGFPELDLMEDIAFSKLLSRQGRKVVLASKLTVSARRWEKMGMVWQAVRNWTFVVLWHLGISAATLARWYRAVR